MIQINFRFQGVKINRMMVCRGEYLDIEKRQKLEDEINFIRRNGIISLLRISNQVE